VDRWWIIERSKTSSQLDCWIGRFN